MTTIHQPQQYRFLFLRKLFKIKPFHIKLKPNSERIEFNQYFQDTGETLIGVIKYHSGSFEIYTHSKSFGTKVCGNCRTPYPHPFNEDRNRVFVKYSSVQTVIDFLFTKELL